MLISATPVIEAIGGRPDKALDSAVAHRLGLPAPAPAASVPKVYGHGCSTPHGGTPALVSAEKLTSSWVARGLLVGGVSR